MLGKRIRELRNERNLTQEEFGKAIGNFEKSTISQWETGERTPGIAIAHKIADFFGVSTDYLLGRADVRKPRSSDDVIDLAESSHKFFWKGRELTAEELQGLLVGEEARRNHLLKLLEKKQDKKN